MKLSSEFLELKRLNLDDWENIPEDTFCLINLKSPDINKMLLKIGIIYHSYIQDLMNFDKVVLTDGCLYQKKEIKEIWEIVSLVGN